MTEMTVAPKRAEMPLTVREALERILGGYSDQGLMHLWWTATGDDWPVPDDLPRKFLLALRDNEPEVDE